MKLLYTGLGTRDRWEDLPSQRLGSSTFLPKWLRREQEVAPSGRSIRDEHLVQWWARKNGVDLDEMARQRSEHYDWLRKHVGKLGVIHNMEARNKHDGSIPFTRYIFEYQIVRINFGVLGAKVR